VGEAAEILALAAAAAFWPVLLGVVIVALRAPRPKLLLASFFAGAMLAAVSVGLVVVYALDGSSLANSSSSAGPIAEIVLGALCIVAALALTRRRVATTAVADSHEDARPGRLEQALERGAPLAFAAGIVLDLAPSPFALVAYKDIASFDIGFAETLAMLIAFYVVALAFVEVPLVGHLVAPHWTQLNTIRFNAWLGRNWQRLAVWALGGLGLYLIVKGTIEIAT
jgi:hypothetical protein